jgi:lipoprotein LprG
MVAGELPDDVDALVEASGIGTHAPAFDGTIKVQTNNLTLEVPVVAVEGLVFAKLPGLKEYVEVEAEDYGAPDPADLMDTTSGLSSWLTAAEDVEKGDETRDGDQVLTTYTGTLPGPAVAEVIPSASTKSDFDARFQLDDDGRLAVAVVTGPFYEGAGDIEYTVRLEDYGTEKDITRP